MEMHVFAFRSRRHEGERCYIPAPNWGGVVELRSVSVIRANLRSSTGVSGFTVALRIPQGVAGDGGDAVEDEAL